MPIVNLKKKTFPESILWTTKITFSRVATSTGITPQTMATPFQSKRLQSAEKSADPSHDYGELESLPEDLRPEKRGGQGAQVVTASRCEKIVMSSFTMIQPECATWNLFVLCFGASTLQKEAFSNQNRDHFGSRYRRIPHIIIIGYWINYTTCKHYCTWPFWWRVDVGMTTSTTFLYWQRFIDTFTMTSQWYSWYSW